MRLNKNTQADLGSIRLRLGSGNNVLTETVTLQAVQPTSFLAPRFHQYVDHFQSVDGNISSS